MSRNDLVVGLLKVLGAYFLVTGIIQIPGFIIVVIVRLHDSIRAVLNTSLGAGVDRFSFSATLTTLLTLALQIVLGLYLMRNGNWFSRRATNE